MKVMKSLGDLLSPSDPQLVEKTLARINQQDTWNDVFSTKLIEVLDKIDGIRTEARGTIRQLQQSADSLEAARTRADRTTAALKAAIGYCIMAVALSWIATVWAIWYGMHDLANPWAPAAISVILVLTAVIAVHSWRRAS